MIINLSPQLSGRTLSVTKSGDILTISGEDFDFGVIPDGATVPGEDVASGFIVGDVSRVDGELRLTLVLPHWVNPPDEMAFPEPIINPADGVLDLPSMPEEPEPETEDEDDE